MTFGRNIQNTLHVSVFVYRFAFYRAMLLHVVRLSVRPSVCDDQVQARS